MILSIDRNYVEVWEVPKIVLIVMQYIININEAFDMKKKRHLSKICNLSSFVQLV